MIPIQELFAYSIFIAIQQCTWPHNSAKCSINKVFQTDLIADLSLSLSFGSSISFVATLSSINLHHYCTACNLRGKPQATEINKLSDIVYFTLM